MATSRESTDDEQPLSPAARTGDTATVDDSYERLVDVRGRLRRDTRAGETFVWTGEPPQTETPPSLLQRVLDRLTLGRRRFR